MSKLAEWFGCCQKNRQTVKNIKSLSITCGSMNYSYTYSFSLFKSENNWVISAKCFADRESSEIEFENCRVTKREADELLNIISEKNLIWTIKHYKKPKFKYYAIDESTYYTSISFVDGKSIGAEIYAGKNLENFFYYLANKYSRVQTKK